MHAIEHKHLSSGLEYPEYIISFCTGTLMRNNKTGRWVTTKQVDEAEDLCYDDLLSPCASFTPFPEYINSLGWVSVVSISTRLLASPTLDMPGLKITPMYRERCHVFPDFISYLGVQHLDNLNAIPGLNLRVVFMNMMLTYEDGIVMSSSASKRFQYKAELTRVISSSSPYIPEINQ